jgi:hypothetical protein
MPAAFAPPSSRCASARPAVSAFRPTADLIELQIRVDALVADIANSVRALGAIESRNPHRGLIAYATSKLRALARQLEAEPEAPPQ